MIQKHLSTRGAIKRSGETLFSPKRTSGAIPFLRKPGDYNSEFAKRLCMLFGDSPESKHATNVGMNSAFLIVAGKK